MNEQRHNLKRTFTGGSNASARGGTEKSYMCFGIEDGHKAVRRLQFILADGRVISMPYAYMPLIVFDPKDDLRLITSDMSVQIFGRGLNILERHLAREKLLWIKEFPAKTDDGGELVFITQISIESDLIL